VQVSKQQDAEALFGFENAQPFVSRGRGLVVVLLLLAATQIWPRACNQQFGGCRLGEQLEGVEEEGKERKPGEEMQAKCGMRVGLGIGDWGARGKAR
jgi:hypothetical protein